MPKQKEAMIPGKRYRGYGFINEYKEFQFEPEDTGSRAGVIKQICSRDGVSLSETKSYLLIKMKVAKTGDRAKLVKSFFTATNNVLKIFRDYEI